MPELLAVPLYVKVEDDLPGNFSEVKINIGFTSPIKTNFTYGLVELIEYSPDSIGKHVLSYTIDENEYFLSLLDNKPCLTETGSNGPLHEAFLLMEEAETAYTLPSITPKPHPETTAYTVYRVMKEENGNLVFKAILKNKYLDKYS
jgi:hypothetical protein